MMGLHLVVVDFRGYGWSTDTAARASTLLSDAEPLFTDGCLEEVLRAARIDSRGLPLILFGRSMGSNVAIHLAALRPQRVAGLVLESGIASMSAFALRGNDDALQGAEQDAAVAEAAAYDAAVAQRPQAGGGVRHVGLLENCDKLGGCVMPTLVLHGGRDRIVPPAQALQVHCKGLRVEAGEGTV